MLVVDSVGTLLLCSFFFNINLFLFIYLAVPSLGCGM